MESEEAVEVENRIRTASRRRDRQRRTRRIVVALTKRHDHVQAVDGAALKNRDQRLAAALFALASRASDERRRETETDERESTVLQKDAA